MNDGHASLITVAFQFAVLSLFAVGGANAAVPEMVRIAVAVERWMDPREFVELFALSQISPGPNVVIVTLIGYRAAGIAGALVATLAMCAPAGVVAYVVSQRMALAPEAQWQRLAQQAMVPVAIGLVAASALILALTIDSTLGAAALTATAIAINLVTRVNPLWLLAAGALAGVLGLV